MRVLFTTATLIILTVLTVSKTGADDTIAAQTARLLAILLDSGRATIAANQALINDPDKSNKGFTPEVFERQLIEIFKQRSGINLNALDEGQLPQDTTSLLRRLVEESKKTVASYQPAINIAGIKYKGLIPATFGTETASRFQAWSGIYMKQTAPEVLLRNPKNKADEFEAQALSQFANPAYPRSGENTISATVENGTAVRVLLPLFYSQQCLSCHGEPKGQRDISGYPKEGGKEGDLGGAISVKMTRK
jgi:general secretion pathway protein A